MSSNLDQDHNGVLSASELAAVTEISVYNKSISSMKGVEHFTALKILSCGGSAFSSLDLSKNKALTDLYCYSSSKLSGLSVGGLSALTCLDAENCTALKWLNCYNCALTTLVVNGCTALESLDCSNNKLTALNVDACKALTNISAYDNYSLWELDLTGTPNLTYLDLEHCTLLKLNVSMTPLLRWLWCGGCSLAGNLDLSANPALEQLSCYGNGFSSLDVSGHSALTKLDAKNNPNLLTLGCDNCALTSITVTG